MIIAYFAITVALTIYAVYYSPPGMRSTPAVYGLLMLNLFWPSMVLVSLVSMPKAPPPGEVEPDQLIEAQTQLTMNPKVPIAATVGFGITIAWFYLFS